MPPGGSYVVTQLDPRTGTQLDLDIVNAGKQSINASAIALVRVELPPEDA